VFQSLLAANCPLHNIHSVGDVDRNKEYFGRESNLRRPVRRPSFNNQVKAASLKFRLTNDKLSWYNRPDNAVLLNEVYIGF
jgi:hypothetical protein